MAGAGYKLFATGDVLTAAQVNTYLQEQAVMVFASATARTTALSGVLAEGMITYLKDTDAVEKYDGSTWVSVGGSSSPLTTKGDLYTYSTTNARLAVGTNGQYLKADSTAATGLSWATLPSSGKVLQVVSATYNTEVSSSSTTLIDSGLSASITPSATTSKILILVSHNGARATNHALKSTLNRGATELCVIDLYLGYTAGNIVGVSNSINWLDSPSTTSATTYKTRFCSQDGSASVSLQKDGAYSTITLMEIGA